MTTELLLLCIAAFAAGFIDAVAGGGGLLQTPAALILLPQLPVANVIGSLKIPAFSGTAIAAFQYTRRVKINWQLLVCAAAVAGISAYAGSVLLTRVSNQFMKPVLLFILIAVAIYTYSKKDFGTHIHRDHSQRMQFFYAMLISIIIGFYDGFIGPGTGSFLYLPSLHV